MVYLSFQEFYVPCTLSRKPLLILHFVLRLKLSPILCFTNSREAAHRFEISVRWHVSPIKMFSFGRCICSADFISWFNCLEVFRRLSSHPDCLLPKGSTRLRIFNKETSSCELSCEKNLRLKKKKSVSVTTVVPDRLALQPLIYLLINPLSVKSVQFTAAPALSHQSFWRV